MATTRKNTAIRSKSMRLGIGIAIGAVLGVLFGIVSGRWEYMPLVSWDGLVVTFLFLVWQDFYRHDAESTAAIARRDSLGRSFSDIVLLVASVASLAAVGLLLATNNHSSLHISIALISIVLSWAMIHAVYMLIYASMYYSDTKGGIDFGGSTDPTFNDFAYLAFTIGMTYQVSDTSFTTTRFRAVALRHALLSFLFGVAIIATSINFLASLAK